MESLFFCPICAAGLVREGAVCRCGGGHSFDIAREGYVNLLPANRQHSKAPGDDKTMASARTAFLEGGWYSPLRDELCKLSLEAAEAPALPPVLLDAGCGEGWYTQKLLEVLSPKGFRVCGVDLSKPSVKRAAKRCKGAEIAVASLYHLPIPDEKVGILVNCFSPLAIDEFRRILAPGGTFLYVVPGPRHLWELKEILYENPYENPEKAEEYPGFCYQSIVPVETVFTLSDPAQIRALFAMTPYAWKTPKAGVARLSALSELTVTAQFRIHVLRRL